MYEDIDLDLESENGKPQKQESTEKKRPRQYFPTYQCGKCGFSSKAKNLFKLERGGNMPRLFYFEKMTLPFRRDKYEAHLCVTGCTF